MSQPPYDQFSSEDDRNIDLLASSVLERFTKEPVMVGENLRVALA
jgi:hypothetical protein